MEAVASKWEYLVQGSQIVIWAVSAGIYRYGREPVDGKFWDLWGWTCSQDAAALQAVVDDVDFEKYCGMQVSRRRERTPQDVLVCYGRVRGMIGLISWVLRRPPLI